MQGMAKKLILIISGVGVLCGLVFCVFYYTHRPAPLDDLLIYDVPEGYHAVNAVYWNNGKSIRIEKDYGEIDGDGYLRVSIFSYKGYDCVTGISRKIDVDDYIETLNDSWKYKVDNHVFDIGMRESDDISDMLIKAYVKDGDYVYEFGLSNFDNPITPEQEYLFKEFVRTVRFKES